MPRKHESVDQFRHHVVGPLLRFFYDLIEGQGHGRQHGPVRAEFNPPIRRFVTRGARRLL